MFLGLVKRPWLFPVLVPLVLGLRETSQEYLDFGRTLMATHGETFSGVSVIVAWLLHCGLRSLSSQSFTDTFSAWGPEAVTLEAEKQLRVFAVDYSSQVSSGDVDARL